MNTFITHSSQETQQIAAKIAQKLKAKGGIIALQGELGAGKTTFVQGFAKALGITEKIISPTFILMKQFQIPNSKQILYHLDLYRLENSANLTQIGLHDLLKSQNDIVVIEWAEKAKNLLPEDTIYINIEKIDPNSRKITTSLPLA